jgi:hypothetical protein
VRKLLLFGACTFCVVLLAFFGRGGEEHPYDTMRRQG